MRNWPRYSRGSLEAEEITRPLRKKIFFSTRLLEMTSVPVFWPRLSHCRRSPGSIVLRLPDRAIEGRGIICSGRDEQRPPHLLLRVGLATTRVRSRTRPRRTGTVPLHARSAGVDVSRKTLDDAAVRGLLDGRGIERAISLSARARYHWSFGRVRPADADRNGLR